MSKRVCSTCKHEPSDGHCKGCTWEHANGNTHWEPKVAIRSLEAWDKIRTEMQDILIVSQGEERVYQQIKAIIDKYLAESEDKK